VKVREMYSSYLMVSGIICLLLGIGNWTVGAIESSKYQALLYKTARTGLEENYRNFQQLDHQKNEEVLRRINEDREKYNGARVKLNFFYIVLTGGRVLFVLGALLTLTATVHLIRRDSQAKVKRLLDAATAEPS
jgi:Flp pilus assembly protein TadB